MATAEQLYAMRAANSIAGVSAVTWSLFLFANLGALFLGTAETRLARLQMALAFGLTALLDLLIVVAVLFR